MAAGNDNPERRVVPRWRSFQEALATGELSSSRIAAASAASGEVFLREKELNWQENRDFPFAVELVSAANVLGASEVAKIAAKEILEAGKRCSPTAQMLARSLLGVEERDETGPQPETREGVISLVRALKVRRVTQPRNAFVWLDLARLYVLLGQLVPAEEALQVARTLAPSDRFILRSAARFYLHKRDPEHALQLLRRNPRTRHDPWLAAAEIAVSSVVGKTPKYVSVGRTLLADPAFGPFHTTELASALGSLEMFAGKNRRANKLFELALIEPTDNSLAQVVWASTRTGLGDINQQLLGTPKAFEAQTFNAYNHGHWSELMKPAERWAEDESFSARPRLLASSIAVSLLDQPGRAIEIAKAGLETNPGNPGLVNNVAVAQAEQDLAKEALESLDSIDRSQVTIVNAICLNATMGLINFRLGKPEQGRKLYQAAIDLAGRHGHGQLKALASLYLARERVRAGEIEAVRDFKKAHEDAKKFPNTSTPAIADHLLPVVEEGEGRHRTTT